MLRRSAFLAVMLSATLGLLAVLPAQAAKVHHVPLQLLVISDFHGALQPSEDADGRPIGGAAVLATYLVQEAHDAEEATGAHSLILGAGDLVGASPPVSGLLHDEPAVDALGLMGLQYSAVGNHELDDGLAELLRLQYGGCHADDTCFDGSDVAGARYAYLAANIVYRDTGEPVFPPYAIEEVGGVQIGLIGVTSVQTADIVAPQGIEGIEFVDEATSVNKYVRELRRKGVETIVVLINPGTDGSLEGIPPIHVAGIVEAMHAAVDVVISGQTREPYVTTTDGKLVVQADADGIAFADIDLVLDRDSGDVVSKQARIVHTYGDVFPGSTPAPRVQTLVESTTNLVAPLIDRVVGTAATAITREQSPSGESALGNLIADALRAKGGTQLAFVNPGSIRGDIAAGEVTWGDLFTIEPFDNDVIRITLTGAQLDELLEQQWLSTPNRVLQVAGIEYAWSASAPPGDRVAPEDVRVEGAPLDLDATYTVTTNAYLAAGGDNFSVFLDGADRQVVGGTDHDAFVEYVESLPQPFTAAIEGRVSVR